jgi:hypothetical protein
MPKWRTGSKEFRTIYEDGKLIGVMDTPLLAAQVVQALTQKELVEREWRGWTPTSANINALPNPVRSYTHRLETRADPAGEIRELILARDYIRQLEAKVSELKEEVARFQEG